jgi:hypothetical protein
MSDTIYLSVKNILLSLMEISTIDANVLFLFSYSSTSGGFEREV